MVTLKRVPSWVVVGVEAVVACAVVAPGLAAGLAMLGVSGRADNYVRHEASLLDLWESPQWLAALLVANILVMGWGWMRRSTGERAPHAVLHAALAVGLGWPLYVVLVREASPHLAGALGFEGDAALWTALVVAALCVVACAKALGAITLEVPSLARRRAMVTGVAIALVLAIIAGGSAPDFPAHGDASARRAWAQATFPSIYPDAEAALTANATLREALGAEIEVTMRAERPNVARCDGRSCDTLLTLSVRGPRGATSCQVRGTHDGERFVDEHAWVDCAAGGAEVTFDMSGRVRGRSIRRVAIAESVDTGSAERLGAEVLGEAFLRGGQRLRDAAELKALLGPIARVEPNMHHASHTTTTPDGRLSWAWWYYVEGSRGHGHCLATSGQTPAPADTVAIERYRCHVDGRWIALTP